jgi:hypothetical protein
VWKPAENCGESLINDATALVTYRVATATTVTSSDPSMRQPGRVGRYLDIAVRPVRTGANAAAAVGYVRCIRHRVDSDKH